MTNKKRAKKRKKSNQSATDENGEDDSFADLSLDIDEAEKTESAVTMDNTGETTATSKTNDSGKSDFEAFVRSALVSMQRTMKKQQSSIDKIAQSQICIKSDIKSKIKRCQI